MKYQSIEKLNRVQQYIMQTRPILQKEALFSDGTKDYRIPAEPKENEWVTIRFRTAKDNVDMVLLHTNGHAYQMRLGESDGTFDYYYAEISLGTDVFSYYFEIVSGMFRCWYDRCGVTKEIREAYFFRIVPGFRSEERRVGKECRL